MSFRASCSYTRGESLLRNLEFPNSFIGIPRRRCAELNAPLLARNDTKGEYLKQENITILI